MNRDCFGSNIGIRTPLHSLIHIIPAMPIIVLLIQGEVETLCDKVVVLCEGQMKAVGPCGQVKNKFGAGFSLQVSNRPNQEILVPDWLITSHVI